MNYQEQIEAKKEVDKRADEFIGWLSAAITPLVENNTITRKQGEQVMLSLIKTPLPK